MPGLSRQHKDELNFQSNSKSRRAWPQSKKTNPAIKRLFNARKHSELKDEVAEGLTKSTFNFQTSP
jgi:hypothetical protein